ncbi:MAG: GH25 family lysozyme [Coriobacteriia bacterium]|nr:GH25 family lysozyme [Coriobacteriia bacterium]
MRAAGGRLALALALLCTCAACLVLAGCGGVSAPKDRVSPYNWEYLTWETQYPSYEDGTYVSKCGIDVSEEQGWIDWPAVADAGVDFAFVRVGYRGITEGGLYADDYAEFNLAAAASAGLQVGAYFYSQATTEQEAREEADFVLDLLDGHKLDLQLAFDLEVGDGNRLTGMTAEACTAVARTFCERVAAAGYQPCLYGNAGDLGYYDDALLDAYPLWFAAYTNAAPTTMLPFVYWQFASDGALPGIDTQVDLDIQMEKIS